MSKLSNTLRALQIGLGLTGTLGLVAGCAVAGREDPASDEVIGEVAQADTLYPCRNAGMTVSGALLVRDDGTCSRLSTIPSGSFAAPSNLAGPSVSCWKLSQIIGCELM